MVGVGHRGNYLHRLSETTGTVNGHVTSKTGGEAGWVIKESGRGMTQGFKRWKGGRKKKGKKKG